MKVIDPHYAMCKVCKVEPWPYMWHRLPEGWTYTVRNSQGGPVVKIHREDCPKGFKKVVIPDVE